MESGTKHKVVAVETWVKSPPFDFPHDFTQYSNTTPSELPSRIAEATIVICSSTRITREGIENATKLQLISANGVGTDHIDKDAVRERGISLCRVPAQNTESVSEHAFALYYSLRRRVVEMHALAMDGRIWGENLGTLVQGKFGMPGPRVNAEEVLVVVGYGNLGKNVERIGKALGMKVLVAERKASDHVREDRTSFTEALQQGTLFILTTPLDASTHDMISTPEFSTMDSSAIIVNVGRGGVINETALATALREGQIAGAGIDVFEHEPVTKENCPLLDSGIPNLVLSPHAAWFSAKTLRGTIATVKANIEGFVAGRSQNLVIDKGRDCV